MFRLFTFIPIFRGFLIKKCKKKCLCVKNVCFGVKKDIGEFWR